MADNSQYNPYGGDPQTPFQTPTLDQILLKAISNQLLEVHVCLPGQITKVIGNNEVNVQPMLQQLYMTDPGPINLPEVQNVPVVVPRGTDYWIKLPVKVGDTGVLLFSERSLDNWLVAGGIVDPDDVRKFDLSDGIFIPGLYPFNHQLPGNGDDMVLHNGLAELYIEKSGKFKITNGSQELVDLTQQLTERTNDLTTETTDIANALVTFATGLSVITLSAQAAALVASLGPIIAQLGVIASELSTIQTELGDLKG